MSDAATSQVLSTEESNVVKKVEPILDKFFSTPIHNGVAIGEASRDTLIVFAQLEEAFPQLAKEVDAFYNTEDDSADDAAVQEAGLKSSLFDLLLSFHALLAANTLEEFSRVYSVIYSHLYDVSTHSNDYDVEKGHWK